MARALHKLTARAVATLRKPGRHSDGGGLYLAISKSGARSWVFFYSRNGRQREMGLGSAAVGGVSLAQARAKAEEARKLLAQGVDPLDAKRAAVAAEKAAATTFGSFADDWIKSHRAGWSNPKHAAQWEMTLGDAYCRAIRDKPISEIGVDDVLAVLTPIWQTKPETARRIRMRLERVLDAARVKGLRQGENPARWRGYLDHLLPQHARDTKKHHGALPYTEVPTFVAGLDARKGTAALALKFTILTAARTGEAIGARWEEFDLEAKTWTVPPDRMKGRRPHRVPLSGPALAVLAQTEGLHEEWVFPGPSLKAPISNMSMLALLRRLKMKHVTVHGFRSSFRDWAAEETSFPSEVAAMALAHVIENRTEAAYRRGDLFEKRRALMDAWAAYLTAAAAEKVVPLRQGQKG